MQEVTRARHALIDSTVKLRIPFINTRPVTDLGILIYLIPVFWFLGVESLILPLGIAFISLKIVYVKRGRVQVPIALRWFFLFIVAYLISGMFIVESFRWITFARNFSVIVTIFLLFLSVVNGVRDWHDIEYLLKSMVFVLGLAGLFGVLSILNAWRPSFSSPFGKLLPDWIAQSDYGRTIVARNFGRTAFFQIVGRYFRVKSIFTFPTLYASCIIYGFPVVFFLYRYARSRSRRLVLMLILVLLAVNLVFTSGRTAILSFFLGGIYYYLFASRKLSSVRIVLTFFIIGFILVAIVAITQFETLLPIGKLAEFADLLVSGRGASTANRLTIYEQTIRGFLDRPIFGWGTERDIPDFRFPAGSHSLYLALLYRHGVVGLVSYLLVLISLWKSTRPLSVTSRRHPELLIPNRFLEYGRWMFVAYIFDSATTVPITDILVIVIFWSILSGLVATRRMCLWGYQKPLAAPIT